MRITTLTKTEIEQRRREWVARMRVPHMWFAWYPVTVADGDVRWLEFVWRRYPSAHYQSYSTEYSSPGLRAEEPEYSAQYPVGNKNPAAGESR